ACNPGNTPQTCRNRQKIGDLSALSAADAVASFSGRVDQTIPSEHDWRGCIRPIYWNSAAAELVGY
ncbi:hypothetical protein, partial [Xanthomonas vasicola]|uniref:hypothetical protein n=1 Tax=Xanthomonas vasicola TaxID=56459 RepID=UPI001A934494